MGTIQGVQLGQREGDSKASVLENDLSRWTKRGKLLRKEKEKRKKEKEVVEEGDYHMLPRRFCKIHLIMKIIQLFAIWEEATLKWRLW